MSTLSLRNNVFKLYLKAIKEIKASSELLSENNFNLNLLTYSRQLFDVAKILEITTNEPSLIWAYFLEVRELELKKHENSNLHSEDQEKYVNDFLKPEIMTIKDEMNSEKITKANWKEEKKKWDLKYKDSAYFNKLSEATHLEITHLIIHYNQTDTDLKEHDRLMLDKEVFNYWYNYCEDIIQNVLSH